MAVVEVDIDVLDAFGGETSQGYVGITKNFGDDQRVVAVATDERIANAQVTADGDEGIVARATREGRTGIHTSSEREGLACRRTLDRITRVGDVGLNIRRHLQRRFDGGWSRGHILQPVARDFGICITRIGRSKRRTGPKVGTAHRAAIHSLGKATGHRDLVLDSHGIVASRTVEDVQRDVTRCERSVQETVLVERLAGSIRVTVEQRLIDAADESIDGVGIDRAVQSLRLRRRSEGIDDANQAAASGVQALSPVQQASGVSGALVVRDIQLLDGVEVGRGCHGGLL